MVDSGTDQTDTAIFGNEQLLTERSEVSVIHPEEWGVKGRSPLGTPPSNTVPSNYIDMLFLRSGIDSLYLSYAGTLSETYNDLLQTLKESAQQGFMPDDTEATVQFNGVPFAVLPKGKGRFPFVLVNNWFHMQVSAHTAKRLPLAYVQIKSEVLTLADFDEVIQRINAVVSDLAQCIIEPKVSRVDLCADFVTDLDLKLCTPETWVCRAAKRCTYMEADKLTGFTFGEGGAVSCRLYNKTVELKKSNKDYLKPLWLKSGWCGERDVWRLEFQLKNTVLREFKLWSVDGLQVNLNSLWAYCSGHWLRHCKPDGTRNQSRWPVSELWEGLHNVPFNRESREALSRVRLDMSPSDMRLFVHGLGSLTSFMAREGIDSLEEALDEYLVAATHFHAERQENGGLSLDQYVHAKVEEKRTKFVSVPPENLDKGIDTSGGADE